MLVMIAGCGRMGRHVAETLFNSDVEVLVIDQSEDALENLSDSYMGLTHRGDARELAVLEEAGIKRADIVLACTGNENTNLLVADVARNIYEVPEVLIRTLDPAKKEFFEKMGFKAVCPVLLGASAVLDVLGSAQQ